MLSQRLRAPGAAATVIIVATLGTLTLASACGPASTPIPDAALNSASASDSAPDFVEAVEAAPYASTTPALDPEGWLLAFVDVETTGLVPGWHEMIDLGVVMTDLDGQAVDSLFVRIQPRHPERTSPGAVAVNGFDVERWQALGAASPADAVAQLLAFHERAAVGRSVMMVAFNSPFDTAFLDHLLRAEGRSWRELYHYFVLDLPSMAWSLGLRELTGNDLSQRLGVPDEPRVADEHTGLTGARLNARLYRALRDWR